MPDLESLPPGTRLGPYEVGALIGAGGMGQVYLARDPRLDRNVAIKVLPPEFATDESRKQRFQREAKTISQFNHPHICTLYDIGEARLTVREEAVQYLVMEYVEGQPLDQRIAKGALPTSDVLRYGIEIADALGRAHKQGIVHRDLKPGNIMLTKSGAKLLDFGLAKFRPGSDYLTTSTSSETAAHTAPLTAEGRLVGTFQYMAPEQFEAQPTDARSDIWALGCVLYEMATGEPAFKGSTRGSLIAAIASSEPKPLSELQPLTPPTLDHVIRKCLAKDTDDRWQSAQDVASELRWIRDSGSQVSVATPVARRRKRREALAWSVAALALIVAVAAGLGFYRARETRKPLALNISPNLGYSLAVGGFAGASSMTLAVSPAGDQVVFGARDPNTAENPLLWVRDLENASARALPGTYWATEPFYSPDGRFLAYFQDEKLRKIPVSGGSPTTICAVVRKGDSVCSGSWNSDGVILFTQRGTPIQRVSADGGDPVPVTTLGPSEISHQEVSFLPDGNHFLYLAVPSPRSDIEPAIYVSSLDGMKPKLLIQAGSKGVYAAGYLLYVRNGTLMAHRMNLEALEVTGDPIPIAENVKEWTQNISGFAASPSGPAMFVSSPPFKMRVGWFDRSGRIEQINTADEWSEARLSPDGNSFVGVIRKGELSDLWLYDLQKNVATRFTFGKDREASPVWSRDGKQIAYVCNARVDRQDSPICLKNADGSGPEVILQPSPAFQWPTDFSPDGQYLAITKKVDGKSSIELLPLRGGKPIPFHPSDYNMGLLHFSPDGKWAAYTSFESGQPETYAVPFPGPGGKWQISRDAARAGWWSRDGSEILLHRPPQWFAVPVAAHGDVLKVGAPQLLFEYRSTIRGDGDSMNGRFLFTYGPENQAPDSLTILLDWTSALKK